MDYEYVQNLQKTKKLPPKYLRKFFALNVHVIKYHYPKYLNKLTIHLKNNYIDYKIDNFINSADNELNGYSYIGTKNILHFDSEIITYCNENPVYDIFNTYGICEFDILKQLMFKHSKIYHPLFIWQLIINRYKDNKVNDEIETLSYLPVDILYYIRRFITKD